MEIEKKELMKQEKKKKKSRYGVQGPKDEGEKNKQVKLAN